MRKTISVLGLVLASLLAIIAQPRCVWACDCAVLSVGEASDGAAAIFAGRVIDVAVPQGTYSADTVAVTFVVSTTWKGTLQPTVTLATVRSEASCGYEFQENGQYLVYARPAATSLVFARPANTTLLEVGLCSRTQPLADAAEDLAALGDGQAPTTSLAETPQPSMLPNTAGEIEAPTLNLPALVVLGALGVVAVVFVGYVMRKRLL